MKKIVKSFLILSIFLVTHSAYAFFDEFNPYMGGSALWWNTTIKRHFGGNNRTAQNYWGGNIFLGARFCDLWSLELGYIQTGKKSKTGAAIFNATTLGFPNNTIGIRGAVKNSFQHFYLDLQGYYPLDQYWELIGSIGIGAVKSKLAFHFDRLVRNGIPLTSGSGIGRKAKATFRLGVGAQYKATECVGIRGTIHWVTTSALRVTGHRSNGNTANFRPFRSTIITSLGVVWYF